MVEITPGVFVYPSMGVRPSGRPRIHGGRHRQPGLASFREAFVGAKAVGDLEKLTTEGDPTVEDDGSIWQLHRAIVIVRAIGGSVSTLGLTFCERLW